MGNAGQACTAAKRMIVVGDLYDEFVSQFTAAMAALRPGDPTDPASNLGPLSSETAAERLMGRSATPWTRAPRCAPAASGSTGRARSSSPPS
jgi:acyl-CoA reductase-like NAD-dependent aldehyde dehydrogenase